VVKIPANKRQGVEDMGEIGRQSVGFPRCPGTRQVESNPPTGMRSANSLLMIAALLLFALIGSSVFMVLLLAHEFLPKLRPARVQKLDVGDVIVYRKQKVSAHPSPRAYDIHPAGQGDTYSYFVDKFWVVESLLRDGRILVTTRTRKHHYLQANDPNLRKAGLVVRLRHRNRLPELPVAA
jgi:hypothetical protein